MTNNRWTKLLGQLYLNLDTGDVELRYGEDQWFRKKLGNIKGTKVYDDIIMSYGTKKGKIIREKAAVVILKSIRYG